jgi:tetraacyldisaccharide 4'-kinase
MHRILEVLAPVVCLPGLLFEALLRVRNGLYSASLLPRHRLPAPVISVGNITMGGAGKTPLVIYIAQVLAALGLHPAVLSRGYGRKNPNASRILPPGQSAPSPASTLGDEPALVRRHVPSAWMGISRDRYAAGSRIVKRQARAVFILDDGFQHRKLHRDLDIVIVDRSQPLGANRIFPRGTLREPVSELRRCHAVVINGAPGTEAPDPLETEIKNCNAEAAIFHCSQVIRCLIPFAAWMEGRACGSTAGRAQSAYLAAALGNPERFQRDVCRLGIEVRGTRFFADHHWIGPKDWRDCVEEARSKRVDAIITTEKDAVKISQPPEFPLLVSIQSTEMYDAHAFELALKNCIEERS